MTHTEELQGYLDAARILEAKLNELCREPMAVYATIYHANNYVTNIAAKMLRGD